MLNIFFGFTAASRRKCFLFFNLLPAVLHLQLLPGDGFVGGLLAVQLSDQVAEDLLGILLVEAAQVGAVADHIGEVLDDIRALDGVVESQLAHELPVPVEVVAPP